jgi:hypothetical protein
MRPSLPAALVFLSFVPSRVASAQQRTTDAPPVYAPAPPPTYAPAPPPTYAPAPPPTYAPAPPPTYAPAPPPTYAPAPTYAPTAAIVIRNDAGPITHRLLTNDGKMLVAECVGDCTMQVPVGSYVFESSDTAELRSGRKKLSIGGPMVIEVSPGSKGQRTTGLVLGSVGPAAIFVGLIGALVVAVSNSTRSLNCSSSSSARGSSYDCDRESTSAVPWLLLSAAGVGATIGGWIMFAKSGTKITPTPYRAPGTALLAPIGTSSSAASAPSSIEFAAALTPVSVPHGGGLGLTVAF